MENTFSKQLHNHQVLTLCSLNDLINYMTLLTIENTFHKHKKFV